MARAKTRESNLEFQYHSPPLRDVSSSDTYVDWRHITVTWKGLPFLRVIKTDIVNRDGTVHHDSKFAVQSEMTHFHFVASGMLTHTDVEAKCREAEKTLREFVYKIQTRKSQ